MIISLKIKIEKNGSGKFPKSPYHFHEDLFVSFGYPVGTSFPVFAKFPLKYKLIM